MKPYLIWAIPVLILALILCGCLNMKTTIKVNKDGSGQVEQVFLVSNAVAGMMNPAAKTDSGEESGDDVTTDKEGNTIDTTTDDSTVDSDATAGDEGAATAEGEKTQDLTSQLMDKEKLEQVASEMGEGVKLVSADPYKEGDFSGYKAVYSFKDINKLKINQSPGGLMPKDGASSSAMPSEEKEYITFGFKKGSPSILTINMPDIAADKAKKTGTDAKAAELDESTINMMKELYKDMKINMDIAVDGNITETNAQYKKAGVVTLLDLDFNKVLADKTAFGSLTKSQANTIEEMKTLVKKVKGLQIELQKKVTVKFN